MQIAMSKQIKLKSSDLKEDPRNEFIKALDNLNTSLQFLRVSNIDSLVKLRNNKMKLMSQISGHKLMIIICLNFYFLISLQQDTQRYIILYPMSEVIEKDPQIEPKSKKLAVRLRLKKSSQYIQVPSDFYSVKQMIRDNNIVLANNNENICKVQIQPLNLSFKNCVQSVSAYFQKQEKVKNVVICKVINKFKEQLKFLHKQLDNILNRPELRELPNKQQQQNQLRESGNQILLKTLTMMQNQNLDISEQNARICQTNKQLKDEVNQMQHYIIQLKQKLNQKQNKVFELTAQLKDKQSELISTKQELQQKNKLLIVLQEEIAGYENKIEQLQIQLSTFKTESRYVAINNSRDSGQQSSFRQGILNASKEEDESSFMAMGKQKDNRAIKLQEIYSKTQEALKKYRNLEDEMQARQAQYSQFHSKVCYVLEKLDLATQQEINNWERRQLLDKVEKSIEERIQKTKQQFSQRQSKLQSMISLQLDEALRVVQSQMSNLGQVPPHFTILDKIQYLSEVIQYNVLAASYPSENTGQDILESLQRRLQQIMSKSEEFKKQLTANNRALSNICQKYEQTPQLNRENYEKLKQIEDLLRINQQIFDNEVEKQEKQLESKQSQMIGSRNSAKSVQMNEYLEELQATIRRIQKNENQSHETCNQQKDKLRTQIKQLLKFNQNLTFKLEQVILDLTNLKDDQDIKAIERQLSIINSKLKENSSIINKDVFQASSSALALQRYNFQLENNKKKYFQQGSAFIEVLMQRLKQIKQSLSEQKFYDICNNVFKQIQQKDENMRQEVGRRRQLLKQRTAVIAQICKQGMRDSSCQNSMRQSK